MPTTDTPDSPNGQDRETRAESTKALPGDLCGFIGYKEGDVVTTWKSPTSSIIAEEFETTCTVLVVSSNPVKGWSGIDHTLVLTPSGGLGWLVAETLCVFLVNRLTGR